jgi:hypothetical protein
MTLQELKDAIRGEHPLYIAAIERIQAEAMKENGENYIDFTKAELPDVIYERLIEDGYSIDYNKFLDWCYRVSGWAGVESFN